MFNKKMQFLIDVPRIISQRVLQEEYYGDSFNCDACTPVTFLKNTTIQSRHDDVRFSQPPWLIKQPLGSGHQAVVSPFTDTFSILNASAIRLLQYFDTLETFNQIPAMWLTDKNACSVIDRMIASELIVSENYVLPSRKIEDQDLLSAWLNLTEHCNLCCSYCYLPSCKTTMSYEIGKTAIEAIFRTAAIHKYPRVKLKYAGGEPLLQFPLVVELHRYAQILAAHHNIELDAVVLSNGTLLTKQIIKDLRRLGVRLMISVDNLPCGVQHEEIQRMYPNGQDSSKDALRGIELALDSGLIPDITVTVSGRNITQLPELLMWLLQHDLPFNLNFYREHRYASNCHDLRFTEKFFIDSMLSAYAVIEENLPTRSLLCSLVDMANFAAPHLRRCSVGQSYLTIDSLGNVSKCQMQMEAPITTINDTDLLAKLCRDRNGIQNVVVDEKDGCQECQWRYWCAGGCPFETYHLTGRYDVKSPHCNIYKALYPEVLRLEGLRLLKYTESTES